MIYRVLNLPHKLRAASSHKLRAAANSQQPGFTLPELSLATAFISVLLISIAVVTINLTVVFQKGVTIKNANDTGRELINEFNQSISASSYGYFYYSHLPEATFYRQFPSSATALSTEGPYYGVFCTGTYSYVWNTGYALRSDDPAHRANLRLDSGEDLTNIRLVRVDDSDATVCQSDTTGNNFVGGSNAIELLPEAAGSLVLYDLNILRPAFDENSGHALYSGSFILGTTEGSPDIRASAGYCTDVPVGLSTDFAYCSINKFNFSARATGGAN